MTARSVYAAAAPDDRPVTASIGAPFGVASYWTVKEPFWEVIAVFCNATTLVRHVPGGGGAETVSAAVPLCPSLVAVIVADPTATPLTRPLPLTVATAVLLLAHVTVRPVSGAPLASFGVAVSWTVCPAWTLGAGGLTVTDATGRCTTVMAALPLCPSLVAVIVAAPTTTPVTSPLELTVAAAGLLDAHVTVRPVSGLPFASLGVAVSCTVLPSFTLADGGATATDATGAGVTVIAAVPLCPSEVAVIVAEPVATAVTRPLAPTVATVTFELAHATARPVNGLPLASLGVAASCTVRPTATLAVAGVTETDATGTLVTVILDAPLCPSDVAVIVAAPNPTAVTSPLPPTVATAALLLAHVTTRPDSGAPLASFGVAVSCSVCPTCRLAAAGLTSTDPTGALLTVTLDVPLWPSLVAVIVVEPVVTPVTSPLALTVATAPFELVHATARPFSGLPFASFGVAVSWIVPPVGMLADAGVTATDATGTFATVTAAVPLFPSLVAVMVAEPGATAVTSPLGLAVATPVLLLPQVTTRPLNGLPFASFGVAASCALCPTCSASVVGVTSTDATA